MEPDRQSPEIPTSSQKINTFALVSFIAAFFVPVVGVVFGHVAISQIRRTHEAGRGFAVAGLILGYCFVLFYILFFIVWFLFFFQVIPLPNV